MSETTIKYNLEVKNDSKKTYDEVNKDARETDKNINNINVSSVKTSKSVNSLGKEFKKAFGTEAKSSLKSVQSAFIGIFTAPIKLAVTAIKMLTKMGVNFLFIGLGKTKSNPILSLISHLTPMMTILSLF
jgi:hypothetical protein